MLSWMKERGFKIEYMEVDSDRGGMIPFVLPSVFDFFDRRRSKWIDELRWMLEKR